MALWMSCHNAVPPGASAEPTLLPAEVFSIREIEANHVGGVAGAGWARKRTRSPDRIVRNPSVTMSA
jgi:hypothetical protein